MTRHDDRTGSGTCKPVNVTVLHMQRCMHVQFRRYTRRVNPLRQSGGGSSAENRFCMRCGSVSLGSISFLMAPMKFIPRFFGFRSVYLSARFYARTSVKSGTSSFLDISAILWIYYLKVKVILCNRLPQSLNEAKRRCLCKYIEFEVYFFILFTRVSVAFLATITMLHRHSKGVLTFRQSRFVSNFTRSRKHNLTQCDRWNEKLERKAPRLSRVDFTSVETK